MAILFAFQIRLALAVKLLALLAQNLQMVAGPIIRLMRLVLAQVPVVVLVTAVGLVMVLERVLARNVAMVMDVLIRAFCFYV
jgi:hypothetical protein